MDEYELDEWDFHEIWSEAPDGLTREESTLTHSYALSPEGYGSLECAGIYQFDLNTYYAFSAWADTTGWGCRDGVDWFGPFESVVAAANSLSQEERRHLGFEHSPVPEDIYRDYEG